MASRLRIGLNRGMESRESRRVELVLPLRTVVLVVATLAVMAAFAAIGDTFLVIFVGIFLALVFEFPVRFVIAKTGLSRGLAATVTVLGAAVAVVVLALLFLVQDRRIRARLPQGPAGDRRRSAAVGRALVCGRYGGRGERAEGGGERSAEWVPDAISAVLGLAGAGFSVFIAAFTILFSCLFLLSDIGNLKRALASVLAPGEDERWLAVWERVTESVSRWAIGVIVIAIIAGTTQGVTAWLLGSSYAVALGVIAGLLDMIPNLGATIAGFILVPVILAEEGLTAALIMLAVVLVYQQVENNVITPKVQGKAVHLSGFFIIVSVTLFGALLGVLGALTAVPLAATIQILVQELTKARREQVAAANAALEPARSAAEPLRASVAPERHICLRHPVVPTVVGGLDRRKRCSRHTAAANERRERRPGRRRRERSSLLRAKLDVPPAAAGPRRAHPTRRPPLP